jgi:hypothetical protein
MDIKFPSSEPAYVPKFILTNHIYGAFGSSFSVLNMMLGAFTSVRQIMHAFQLGLAPLLKRVFDSYVYVFHGSMDYVTGVFSWLLGMQISIPASAHDYIVIWFVLAGACFRLFQAAERSGARYREYTIQGYRVLRVFDGSYRVFAWIDHIGSYHTTGPLPIWLSRTLQYLICLVIWPVLLVQAAGVTERNIFLQDGSAEVFDENRSYSISYGALLLLQLLGTVFTVFVIAFSNAQLL